MVAGKTPSEAKLQAFTVSSNHICRYYSFPVLELQGPHVASQRRTIGKAILA